MSAASMAMSVPVPMAMPTSAWVSAGASLMPSPTMATAPHSLLQAPDLVHLAVGQHLGHHVVDARPPGDGLGGAPVVAGEHGRLQCPGCAGLRSPRRASCLSGSATANSPTSCPSTATSMARLGLALQARQVCLDRRPCRCPPRASSRALPTSTCLRLRPRPRCPCRARPESRSAAPSATPRARRASTIARPIGCSLPRSAEAARRSSSRSSPVQRRPRRSPRACPRSACRSCQRRPS